MTRQSLESFLSWSKDMVRVIQSRIDEAHELTNCIVNMNESTVVALTYLKIYIDSVKQGVSTLEALASHEMGAMDDLLQRYGTDLAALAGVPVSTKLVNGAASHPRTLVDYVSAEQVSSHAEVVQQALRELQQRYDGIMRTDTELDVDFADLFAEVMQSNVRPSLDTLDTVVALPSHTQKLLDTIRTCARGGNPAIDELNAAGDALVEMEEQVTEALETLGSDRNELIYRHLNLVQDISSLQSDYTELRTSLADMDAALIACKQGGHLEVLGRPRRLLWAYMSALVEVVRRSEFSAQFMHHAQHLAELMAKVSDAELSRRKRYAVDVATQLPWDTAGMEGVPPVLDITIKRRETRTAAESQCTRDDIAALGAALDALGDEKSAGGEARRHLDTLASELDASDAEFKAMARRELGLADLGTSSDDGSQEEETPATAVQDNVDERRGLERQLASAQARAQRLEMELRERTRTWNEERQQLQRLVGTLARKDTSEDVLPAPSGARDARRVTGEAKQQCISVTNLDVGSLALFLPMGQTPGSDRLWAALHLEQPHFYLRTSPALSEHLRTREWLIARIAAIERHVAGADHPLGLANSTRYAWVDVEGWEQPYELTAPPAAVPNPRDTQQPGTASRWSLQHSLLPLLPALQSVAHGSTTTTSPAHATATFVVPRGT